MSSGAATTCPSCNKPLPAAIVNGPAQAVVRCDGCQTLLLWSNGRVMRSAKSSTGTMMGMPVVKLPTAGVTKEAEAPLRELKPEGDAAPAKASGAKPATPVAKAPPPRGATQPLARVTPQKTSVTGLTDNVPTKVAPPPPELRKEAARRDPTPVPPARKDPTLPPVVRREPTNPAAPPPRKDLTPAPMKVPPSGPVKLPAGAKPASAVAKPAAPTAKGAPATGEPAKGGEAHVVAAVAQVPQMPSSGDMVDPSAWFAGDVSEVVAPGKLPTIESAKPLRAEPTGAAPLPPPPAPVHPVADAEPFEIEPFGEEKTPAVPISLVDMPSGPIAMDPSRPIAIAPPRPAVREPSQKIATPPPPSQPAAREPSQKIATPPPASSGKKSAASIRGADPLVPATVDRAELPNVGTAIGKPPEAAPSTAASRATLLGQPALEPPKASAPLASAVSMLPPSPAPAPVIESLKPVRTDATPVRQHAALNAPEPLTAKEPSVEALPPPPMTPQPSLPPLDATSQTMMPPVTARVAKVSRRSLFVVGGAASGVIVLVVVVLMFAHGGSKPTAVAAGPKKVVPVTAPSAPPTAPSAPPTAPSAQPTTPTAPTAPPAAASGQPTAPAPTTEPSGAAVAAPTAPPRRRGVLGGKKVVLEYDPKPTSPAPATPQAPTPMGEDPSTVARAREAYHKGNVKLFAGDTQGAIALYRESLKIYPGYVAGYRGLGLGYETAGNVPEALKAFHTYVRTVPSANDTPIIRRRIDRLEATKQ